MKKILSLLLTLALLCPCFAAMAANLYENGMQMYDDGQYEAAMVLWKQAALDGDVAAMNAIGILYYSGSGVEQDYAKAREWFEKAAALGHEDALECLAELDELIQP